MSTLDIIKYISFRQKNSGVLTIIPLPISVGMVLRSKMYFYHIENEKHIPAFRSALCGLYLKHDIKCNICTIFGDKYKGYFHQILYSTEKMKIEVMANEEMKYEENYYLRSINHNKRFELMELEE